jgi:biopolymer transport protein ExbD
MAVSLTPARSGGRRPLDASFNLVPFIDLLSCCIAFLLITAVWSQVSALEVQQGGGAPGEGPPSKPLVLAIDAREYRLTLPDGTSRAVDRARLSETLKAARGDRDELLVEPTDGVSYERLVGGLDAARAAGFVKLALSPTG